MSAGTITAVKPNPKNPAQGFVKITTMVKVPTPEDPTAEIPGETIEAWTPEFEKAEALNGQLIPDDWTLKDNKQGTGKVLLPPREGRGGGGGGYRQSKEAFEAEQASRLAWQQVEEERKDRRTALMTAAELLRPAQEKNETGEVTHGLFVAVSDWMYEWLRSSPAAGPPLEPDDRAKAPNRSGGAATKGEVTPPGSASGRLKSEADATSPAGDISSALGGVEKSPIPGDTSADTKPGEGATPSPSPGFPISATECTHKFPSGRWVKWMTVEFGEGAGLTRHEICPKCGTLKLVAMEGTNADLGPA